MDRVSSFGSGGYKFAVLTDRRGHGWVASEFFLLWFLGHELCMRMGLVREVNASLNFRK